MEFNELKDQLNEMGKPGRELMMLATLGGKVRAEYAAHAETTSSAREFFDAVYADDDLRFTPLWAAWAKESRKDWLGRFEPERVVRGVRLLRGSVPIEFAHGGTVIVPAEARGQHLTIMEFADGAINEEAARFFGAVEGSFTCAGMEFSGTYDVLVTKGVLMFVRWAVNERGQRTSEAELAKQFCKTRCH